MAIKFTNNASSKLTQALSANATSMHINAEDVSKFPTLTSDDYCLLTLVGDNGNHEIIKTTAISSDGTCTIVRAQDSTTAKAWDIDTRVELRITAEYLNSTADNEEITSSITNIESDISDIKNEINNIVDSIPIDAVTITRSSDGKLQVEDIAIGGDVNDLASDRGIFDSIILEENANLNTITTQGIYSAPSTTENSPGFASKILTIASGPQYTISQFALANLGTKLASRGRTTINENSVWQDWTNIITDNSIGDGITVNNGIISVPEYEGATSSASATSGLVPPATSAERNNFLRGDGTWQQVDLSDYALKTDLTKYLPLTGGTLTGTVLTSSNASLRRVGTNGFLQLGMETIVNGGRLNLFGKDYTDTEIAGGFQLLTGNGVSTVSLEGSPNEILTWNGKNIVRSVGGVEADTFGNVDAPYLPLTGTAVSANKLATARTTLTNLASTSPASFDGTTNITPGVTGVLPVANGGTGSSTEKYLPLTGGTLTGNLIAKGGIYANKNTLSLSLGVGSSWNTAPSLSFFGMDDTSHGGKFILRSGANAHSLVGYENGDLKWDSNHIINSDDIMFYKIEPNTGVKYLPDGGSWYFIRLQSSPEGKVAAIYVGSRAGGSAINVNNSNNQVILAIRTSY